MKTRRGLLVAVAASICGGALAVAVGSHSETKAQTSAQLSPPLSHRGFLAFAQTPPRRPGNLLLRSGVAGRSAQGRAIGLRQLGDPAIDGGLLVFGCIHGDECAAGGIQPLTNGCPDPRADIYVVANLNPDAWR